MTYRIKLIDGQWRLLRHGAIIASFGTWIEARDGLGLEMQRRGEL